MYADSQLRILSIDLGSTYVRVGVYDTVNKRFFRLVLAANEEDTTLSTVGKNGQLPAISLPMIPDWANPDNIGTAEAAFSDGRFPVKYYLYFLAGYKKEDLCGMEQIHELYGKAPVVPHNLAFRLRRTLEIFFHKLGEKAQALAERRKVTIKSVALTYPPIWNREIMTLYSKIVEKELQVFWPEIATDDFHLVSESEACAWTVRERNLNWLLKYDWHMINDVAGHTYVSNMHLITSFNLFRAVH
jgi:hypothetical protein